jgi:hypothetical protein
MTSELAERISKLRAMVDELASGEFGPFDDDQTTYIQVVQQNAARLEKASVMRLSLIGLSHKSHDLRQLLTALVGYSALLNSPKLSSHATLQRKQLFALHNMHELARDIHWRLDGLILFANQIVRPKDTNPQDVGMLNLAGYLRAQAEHYVCRQFVHAINIPDNLPHVYANDAQTRLMLRAIFAISMDLVPTPILDVQAYTMMKFVRARVGVYEASDQYDTLMQFLDVEQVYHATSEQTQSMQMTVGKIHGTNMTELGLYIATDLASRQGGRMKLERDKDRLVFTLTMPTEVPRAAH